MLNDLGGEVFDCYLRTGLHFDAEAHKERLKDLNLYDQIREMTRLSLYHKHNTPDWQGDFEEVEITYDKHLAALQKSLFAWSRKWGLDETWCRQRAFSTLDWWCSYPDLYKEKMWSYDFTFETVIAVGRGEWPTFVFEFKTFFPREGTRAETKRRITEAFNDKLKASLDERELLAKEAG